MTKMYLHYLLQKTVLKPLFWYIRDTLAFFMGQKWCNVVENAIFADCT